MSILLCDKRRKKEAYFWSIQSVLYCFSLAGSPGGPADPSCLRAWGSLHPGRVPSSSQRHTRDKHPSTSTACLSKRPRRRSVMLAGPVRLCSSQRGDWRCSGRWACAFSFTAGSFLVINDPGNAGGRGTLRCFILKLNELKRWSLSYQSLRWPFCAAVCYAVAPQHFSSSAELFHRVVSALVSGNLTSCPNCSHLFPIILCTIRV